MKIYITLLLTLTLITSCKSQNYSTQNQNSSQPFYNVNDTTVLATVNNQNYTLGDFNKGRMLGEFILGQHLNSYELNEAIEESVMEFKKSPSDALNNSQISYQTISQIYGMQDAFSIALIRNQLIAEVYSIYQNLNETSVLFELMKKYIKINHFDSVNKLVLLEEDVEGVVNLYKFNYKMYGISTNFTNSQINVTKQEITSVFLTGTLQQKQYICVMNTYYQLLQQNYNNLDQQSKQQLRNQYMAQNQQYQQPQYQQAQNNYNDANTRNAYSMLSNMSLQNHASMMNSIEAIGGSGNYWYLE